VPRLCAIVLLQDDRKAAHVLSAFATDGQIILGHLLVQLKANQS